MKTPALATFTSALFLVSLIIPGKVCASTIADARGDYVPGSSDGDPGTSLPATGTGTWSYFASDTVNPILDGALDPLLWYGPNSAYMFSTSGGSSDLVGLVHPNVNFDEIGLHPSGYGRNPRFSVMRWTAGLGEAGQIQITGIVRKVNTGEDGITFDLFVDGNPYFNTTVAYNDTVGVSFNQTVTVSVGSTVDFVVGPNFGDSYDATGLKATISQVPEPASVLLLGGGLLCVPLFRRNRQRTASGGV